MKRQRLRQFLLQEIELIKESDDPDKELLKTLYAAVEGLENLEFGQVDEIFAAAKVRFRGARPATVKLCQDSNLQPDRFEGQALPPQSRTRAAMRQLTSQ